MESQIPRPPGHNHDEDPHNVGSQYSVIEGEDEHHHEKKSVLKKVKAKAKKIKDTLKMHGHGHDHHDEHDNDEEEDEDEDEEDMVEDPEIHGAPMYESAAVRSAVDPGLDVNVGQPRVNLERPSAVGEDRYDSKITDPPATATVNLGRPTSMVMEAAAHVPEDKRVSFPPETYGTKVTNPIPGNINVGGPGQEGNVLGQPRINIGRSTGLEEDPHAPKDRPHAFSASNYQTKVTDPTGAGGVEAGLTSILHSFNKMNVNDEPGPEQNSYTGSHDQFSPESLPTDTTAIPENPESSVPKSFDGSRPEDLPRDTLTGKPSNQSSYTEKISSATSAIVDKATSAKNVVASKLGYGGNEDTGSQEMQHGGGNVAKSASPAEYGRQIATTVTEKLAPVYEKVADAGSSVMSKVHGTGPAGQESRDKGPDRGVSVKEYLVEKFRPSEEDRALSEVITNAFHKRNEEPDEKAGEAKPMAAGKVTESEEVARRLGTGDKDSSHEGANAAAGIAGNVSAGQGVVDRLKGAVSSWLGKGGAESETSQGSLGTSYVGNEGVSGSASEEVGHDQNDGAGERRLQESSN